MNIKAFNDNFNNFVSCYDFDDENLSILLQRTLNVMNAKYCAQGFEDSYNMGIYSILSYVVTGDNRYLSSKDNLRKICTSANFDKLILDFFEKNNIDFSISNLKKLIVQKTDENSVRNWKDIAYIYVNLKNDKLISIQDACDYGFLNCNIPSIINSSIIYFLTSEEERFINSNFHVKYALKKHNYKAYLDSDYSDYEKVDYEKVVNIYKNSSTNELFLNYEQAISLGIIDSECNFDLFVNISSNIANYLEKKYKVQYKETSFSSKKVVEEDNSKNDLTVYVDDLTDECYLKISDASYIGLDLSNLKVSRDGKYVKLGIGMDIILTAKYNIKYENKTIYEPRHLKK